MAWMMGSRMSGSVFVGGQSQKFEKDFAKTLFAGGGAQLLHGAGDFQPPVADDTDAVAEIFSFLHHVSRIDDTFARALGVDNSGFDGARGGHVETGTGLV